MDQPERHCDDYIDDPSTPECLRRWLSYHRLAATLKRPDLHNASLDKIEAAMKWIEPEIRQYLWTDPEPVLFADQDGKRVRCVMASRFGYIGITEDLSAVRGYDRCVMVGQLSNFSINPTETVK